MAKSFAIRQLQKSVLDHEPIWVKLIVDLNSPAISLLVGRFDFVKLLYSTVPVSILYISVNVQNTQFDA